MLTPEPEVQMPQDLATLQDFLLPRLSLDNVIAIREALLIAHGDYMPQLVKEMGMDGAVLHVVDGMKSSGFLVTVPREIWPLIINLTKAEAKQFGAFANNNLIRRSRSSGLTSE